ncbi:MAG: hypothetical protein Q8909_17880 [Bacteroidota bacterium]|nr:hypothetical protein [Bacteroidota bacterium]
MKELGWQPYVVTVQPAYFEETPDPDFEKTFSPDFIVSRVKAFPVTKPRLIGDIGLRSFFQIKREALRVIRENRIDFIWIPIPSFYMALMGRMLYEKTKVPYGIDYIDPWVRDMTNQKSIRMQLSQWVAKMLEPIAVKKVSLISGVSTPYYEPVIKRNFPTQYSRLTTHHSLLTTHNSQLKNSNTNKPFTHVGMPYGFDPNDHKVKLENLELPWDKEGPCKIWLYAGAFLPNSHLFMKCFFEAIAQLRKEKAWDESIRLYFLGTGLYPAKRITAYAEESGIADIVTENRERMPFLHILNYLSLADTVMVIGSTEKHYTASKTYQSVLSERPVWAIFHKESSAVQVLKECNADGFVVEYAEEMSEQDIVSAIKCSLKKRLVSEVWNPDYKSLDKYSSRESARKLVEAIEMVL